MEKHEESFDDLLIGLRSAFATNKVNIEEVKELLESYVSQPKDWKRFAKFDRYRYTRNLIDEGNGRYNLMLLCWGEGHGSAIHDHSQSHCFMKVLKGKLNEIRFAWPTAEENVVDSCEENFEEMKEISRKILETDSVCYINDDLGLHRVENPSSTDVAVSLHLYCPPFDSCQVFNQRTGRKSTSKVTFWSRYGNKPDRRIQEEMPPEDN